MNLNEMSFKDVAAIVALLNGNSHSSNDVLQGKYVIVRCYSAGVHAGTLVQQDKDVVLLKDARRLWNWKARQGVALNGVAAHGIQSGCKIDESVDLVRLTGVIETISATEVAKESIHG